VSTGRSRRVWFRLLLRCAASFMSRVQCSRTVVRTVTLFFAGTADISKPGRYVVYKTTLNKMRRGASKV
jgi:hypothetical protein